MSSGGRKVIMIGVPCYSQVSPEVLEDWMRFAYHCGRRMPQYDFLLGIRTKAEQFRARNAIVDAAMQCDVDYLLMLDDDMVININSDSGVSSSYDFLGRLIAHDKDIVGALYFQRQGECNPVAMVAAGSAYRFLRMDEVTGGLQRVDVVGGGCMLIKMRVFDKLHRPYFEPEFNFGTDIQLCRKAAERGFEVWLDSSIELGHVRNERTIVTSRNRHMFLDDLTPGEARKFISSEVYDRLIHDVEEYTGIKSEDFGLAASSFLANRADFTGSDHDWYKTYGKQRIARQAWFNTANSGKRTMTEFIISNVDHSRKLDILDFGCGIGIPAYALASRGHIVTAMDLDGTETIDFLEWRSKRSGVPIDIVRLNGDPHFSKQFDVIVAMDCLEHIAGWRNTVRLLSDALKPNGVLFANNAILQDDIHPEHYHLGNAEFVTCCAENGLLPLNQISYVKRPVDGQ